MFNLIDLREGDKVDFWILGGDPFDESRFNRRRTIPILGASMSVSTPEDTILSKLRWARLSGGSEKQYGDALGVCEVQWGSLDRAYIGKWAEKLGVTDLWLRILREMRVS